MLHQGEFLFMARPCRPQSILSWSAIGIRKRRFEFSPPSKPSSSAKGPTRTKTGFEFHGLIGLLLARTSLPSARSSSSAAGSESGRSPTAPSRDPFRRLGVGLGRTWGTFLITGDDRNSLQAEEPMEHQVGRFWGPKRPSTLGRRPLATTY
jgi:hypothetical protein